LQQANSIIQIGRRIHVAVVGANNKAACASQQVTAVGAINVSGGVKETAVCHQALKHTHATISKSRHIHILPVGANLHIVGAIQSIDARAIHLRLNLHQRAVKRIALENGEGIIPLRRHIHLPPIRADGDTCGSIQMCHPTLPIGIGGHKSECTSQ
jgi:hypothetical protein